MKWVLRKGTLWFMFTGLIAVASLTLAQQPTTGTSSDDDDAEMKKLVERACTSCHGIETITSAQKSKDEWTEVTRNMISYGAEVKEAQVAALAEYLAKRYGPKK